MDKHIILAAFGTTTQAKHTYDKLHSAIGTQFPQCTIHWTFTSPRVRQTLSESAKSRSQSLVEILDHLSSYGEIRVVIQSLHITPGHEFHRVVRNSRQSKLPMAIGLPLLSSPDDYTRVADCLLPLMKKDPENAVLVLGHGTNHPSWTAYPAIESVLRAMVGNRVFVSSLEKFPDSSQTIDKIAAAGFKRVTIIPFLMVAGMHFHRDIIGATPASWKNQFLSKDIAITLRNEGIGLLNGISDIFCDHIRAAFDLLE